MKYVEYKPFGETKAEEGSIVVNKKFTGKELDDSTGLYDYGARHYNPQMRRFVSADTVDPDLTNPQTLNRYSYCLNNPLKYVDPSGNVPVDYTYDPVLLAMSWDAYESEPTFLNKLALGVDTALTFIPYAPAVGGVAIRGAGRFFSKADDIGRAAKMADRGGDIGRAAAKGEEFVHVAPKRLEKVIRTEGLDPQTISTKRIWFSKEKYTFGKTAKKYEEVAKMTKGKLKRGAIKVTIEDATFKPVYKGMTKPKGGIPQWVYRGKGIPPSKLKIERYK